MGCVLVWIMSQKKTLVAHPGFEGWPGGAEEANISQHHRDLDSIPGCGAPGSVGHSAYFAAKGIHCLKAWNSLLHFRTQKWTAVGPIGALLLCEHGACLWVWPLLMPWHILVSGVMDSSSSPLVELCVYECCTSMQNGGSPKFSVWFWVFDAKTCLSCTSWRELDNLQQFMLRPCVVISIGLFLRNHYFFLPVWYFR